MSAIKHHYSNEINAAEPEPIVDCVTCMNYGCIFCLPQAAPVVDNRDFGIDPFEGGLEGEPATEWTDEACEAHARETHAKVLAGELNAMEVYGELDFDPFA